MSANAATTAAAQLDDMLQALQALEGELLAASADANLFRKLTERRDAMRREAARLEYGVRREAAEAEAAHVAALHDRVIEASDRGAWLRRQGAELDVQIQALLAELNDMLIRAAEMTREHAACASRGNNAIAALRKAGQAPQRAGIGDARFPGQDVALKHYQAALRMLGALNLHENSLAVVMARQTHRRA